MFQMAPWKLKTVVVIVVVAIGQLFFHGGRLMGKTYDFKIKINDQFFSPITIMMFEMREKTIGES